MTQDAIPLLLDPALDQVFTRPSRLGVDSAWYGHLAFAGWLVRALEPRLLVELGTHCGVSYAGFCDAVVAGDLATRCFAVDGWAGDEHAGFYDETVLANLRAFHDTRYGTFSRLLQMRFDDAVSRFADGSIDLLHIDGRHRFEDVAHDYRTWLPKLSPRAIVLLHDTNVREHDFGVWRFWAELAGRHPSFEFLHGHGLGVIAPGSAPPESLASLWALAADPAGTARLRDRFALLGERWEVEFQRVVDARDRQALAVQAATAEPLAAELEQATAELVRLKAESDTQREALQALQEAHHRLRDDLAHSKLDRHRLSAHLGALETAERVRDQAAQAQTQAARAADAALLELTAAHRASMQALEQAHLEREAMLAAEHARQLQVAAQGWQEERARLQAEAAAARVERIRLQNDLEALQASASWRLTRPARIVLSRLRGPDALPAVAPPSDPAPPALPVEADAPVPEPLALPPEAADHAVALAGPEAREPEADVRVPEVTAPATDADPAPARLGWRPIRRILFVAGEPGTPGATYRTLRNAAACARLGYQTETVDVFDVNPGNLGAADLVVLWRAAYSGHIQTLIRLAHEAGTRVVFDLDDLIVKPSLAVIEIIDGIRTNFLTEAESRSYFLGMLRTLISCDLCTTTTLELAGPMGEQHPIVHVLPNTFDAATERASRRAVRLRGEQAADGRIRLGYAGGTRTHQKDFAEIADALARVLSLRPETLLVLFRDPSAGGAGSEGGLVLIEEFPALLPFADRIEWRDMVPLAELPGELARFDVSLCPLQPDNPFCEAKSELKYFESALAGVCVVASPTGPFRRAVQDGVTGFLADDADSWERLLLQLVEQPELRRRIARNAYHDVLWQFGPRRQSELWSQLLTGLDGGAEGARAAELALHRGTYRASGLPEIPDSELLYCHDSLGEASVTVGMTSYNYEMHIGEALESVLAQTLDALDLVVVDDGSRDGSVPLLLDWAERNRLRFNRVRILRTRRNAGLGGARNVVFDQAETPWIMVLDSDNRLAPEACERLLRALDQEPLAGFAYPHIRQFEAKQELMGAGDFDPFHLASGNYIDAMAMIAKWAWASAGGYYVRRDAMGWEDFSLWCRLVELGQFGIAVPEELAEYRVHPGSMVNAITEQDANKRLMVEFVETRHPWLRLKVRGARQRL
ncbi:glycosyltransferase [Lichenicola sp.]|uniref:glycosyltransferase n=1 Tax=Lichenicola sp. TaxID=2804529 RepID=UPI003B00BC73